MWPHNQSSPISKNYFKSLEYRCLCSFADSLNSISLCLCCNSAYTQLQVLAIETYQMRNQSVLNIYRKHSWSLSIHLTMFSIIPLISITLSRKALVSLEWVVLTDNKFHPNFHWSILWMGNYSNVISFPNNNFFH